MNFSNSSPKPRTSLSAVTRRQFLCATTAAVASFQLLPARILGAQGQTAPGSKITLSGVGVGGVGNGQLQELEQAGFQIVALCDVDDKYAAKSFDRWPQARRYRDYRELLSTEGDKIDALYCGTPDHTHALITLAALRKKKHVCCVKPLTRTIHELNLVVKAAREAKVATQVTAAANTGEAGCRITELVSAGVIGSVSELHLWSNRPVWPQGMMRPTRTDTVPDYFDWKMWLGPAADRPFVANWGKNEYPVTQMNLKDWDPGIQAVYHPFNFRGWWDFGTGALGDMGCHHFNTPFRALKLGSPGEVEASASKVLPESAPLTSLVTWTFPARASMPPLRATWYDGGLRPACPPGWSGKPWPNEGTMLVGSEGWILNTWDGVQVFPDKAAKRAEAVARTLPRRPGTWAEWAVACRGGEPAGCNFDLAGPLTETVLLGNAALRIGKRLAWDGATSKFKDSEDANRLLHDTYHNGWSLET